MTTILTSLKLGLKSIFSDPVNIFLAVIPSLISLSFYILGIMAVLNNSDMFYSFFKNNLYSSDSANLLTNVLTAFLVIIIFFVMNWTFVIVLGIISCPFNSILSHRVEQKMVQGHGVGEETKHAMSETKISLLRTLKNELKKMIFLLLMTGLVFILNLVPFLYPLGFIIVSLLLAIQFLDYSWSRHQLSFLDCMRDVFENFFSYTLCGGIFLALISIPLVNAFVPSLATSFFTVLWLGRQKKINLVLNLF
jgi:CysZ protein